MDAAKLAAKLVGCVAEGGWVGRAEPRSKPPPPFLSLPGDLGGGRVVRVKEC